VGEMRYRVQVEYVARIQRERDFTGLCADCQHARRIESARRSAFYLCQRSTVDATFPKYPRLPVMQCSGYASPETEGS
jgi:hypothetical protein